MASVYTILICHDPGIQKERPSIARLRYICCTVSLLIRIINIQRQHQRSRHPHSIHLSLSRFKLAGPPTPRDTEASNAYAVIHDSLGPVCMCSLIGINSLVLLPTQATAILRWSDAATRHDPALALYLRMVVTGLESGGTHRSTAAYVRLHWRSTHV